MKIITAKEEVEKITAIFELAADVESAKTMADEVDEAQKGRSIDELTNDEIKKRKELKALLLDCKARGDKLGFPMCEELVCAIGEL